MRQISSTRIARMSIRLLMVMTMSIVQLERTKTSRGISLLMGVGIMATKVGDMPILVALTAMNGVQLVVEAEDAMIAGKTIATGGHHRHSPLPVIQRAKNVKRRARRSHTRTH
jgi:hypothetical protein